MPCAKRPLVKKPVGGAFGIKKIIQGPRGPGKKGNITQLAKSRR
jgi:hypothetical protein